MDAASVSKMNDMVKNLTKHGIISNSEEAVKMAEKMYNVEKGEKKSEEAPAEDVQVREMEESSDKSDYSEQKIQELVDKRAKQLIDDNNKAIILEFHKLWERLNKIMPDIESRLADIKQNINVSVTDVDPEASEVKPEAKEEPKASEASKNSEAKDNHPRSGGFNTDDVSVEKFFYCGQK